jgi:hypothetical protein
MTTALCATFCTAYSWFGLEYSTQCFCGPYPRNSSVPAISGCDMPCGGDARERCGGPNRLDMYSSPDAGKSSADPVAPPLRVGGYAYFGCVVDGGPRMLGAVVAGDDMTVETCLGVAAAGGAEGGGGWMWAGVEYGRECWMGNELLGAVRNGTGEECGMVCAGDVGVFCGGPSRLGLYRLG